MITTLAMTDTTTMLALFGAPGWLEIVALLMIGVLLFGRRLPEVGRNVGRSIVEFKRGLRGVADEIDEQAAAPLESDDQADLPPAKVTPDPDSTSRSEEERFGEDA